MRKLTELVRRFTNWCSTHKAVTALMMAVLVLGIPLHYTHAGGELFTQFLNNPIDTTMITLAGIIQVITGAVGKLILLIIQVVVIPVLGYNGFYNSHITNLGWSLVRDVVNMFVVVILMVIAIMTIVGYSAANWTQQLPKLFIAIVLVNFSKLICGFLIDVSQVIMFTFVNAIVSIAAGNFASMLSLNTFNQFGSDFIDKINETGTGLEAFEFLMGAYLQFVVMLAILGVMFLLAVAFVWRIVILWILIIMSPLAFFMIGVKDVFHAAESSYKQWWEKFTSALTFGPTMVFFLWLALAASSGSNLAQTEDFPMPKSQGDAGIPLEMFSLDNFLGMFLALAILLAGMQQASSAAAGMGGFASSVLSEDMGKGLLKGVARPFNTAKRVGKAGVSGFKVGGVDIPGLKQVAPGYTQKLGKTLANTGTSLSKKLGGGVIAGAIGGTLASAGAFVAHEGKEERKARNKIGADEAAHMTDDQKTAHNLARADVANGQKDIDAGREMQRNSAKGSAEYKAGAELIAKGEARAKPGQGVLANYTNEMHGARSKDLATKVDEQDKLRKDLEDKYKAQGKENYKDLASVDYDETMRNQLAYASSDEGKAFMQLSGEEKEAVKDTYTANPHLIEPTADQLRAAGGNKQKAKSDAIVAHFKERADKKGSVDFRVATTASLGDPAVQDAMNRYEVEGKGGAKVKAWDYVATNGTNKQKEAIASTITGSTVQDPARREQAMRTLVGVGAVADKQTEQIRDNSGTVIGTADRRDSVLEVMNSENAGGIPPSVHGAASAAFLGSDDSSYNTTRKVFGDEYETLRSEVGPAAANVENRVDAMIATDAKSTRHLADVIPAGAPANAATKVVTDNMSKNTIDRLERSRAEGATQKERDQSAAALVVMKRAAQAEHDKAKTAFDAGDTSAKDRVEKMKKHIDNITVRERPAYNPPPTPPPVPPAPPAPGPTP